MTPTRRLVGLLLCVTVVAVLPVVFSGRFVAAWGAAVVGTLLAVAIDVALAPTRRGIEASVTVPSVLVLGERRAIRLRLSSRAPVATRVEALFDLDAAFAPVDESAVVVPAGGSIEAELPVEPRRRGALRVGDLWLAWTGPLGLVRRGKREPVSKDIVVLPDLSPVRAAAMRFAFAREFLVGARPVRRLGDGSEFEALRDHLPGMDRRAIDWKASARHLQLASRETRAERDRPVVVALDTGRLMGEPVRGLPRVDHAIRAALLLAYAALKSGDRVGLFAFDDRPRAWVAPTSGPGAFARLLAATGTLAYSVAETNYALAVASLASNLSRRTLVVVLTDFVDSTTAELMLDGMSVLARRHLVLFAAMRDAELTSLAEAEPKEPMDLHRAVVASDFLRDREVALRKLRRAGALVVDAPAERLSSELLDQYLHAHRRELVG